MSERERMVPYFGFDVVWRRLGIGVECALGYWLPREWSVHVHIGPLLIWGGMEERDV